MNPFGYKFIKVGIHFDCKFIKLGIDSGFDFNELGNSSNSCNSFIPDGQARNLHHFSKEILNPFTPKLQIWDLGF